MTAREMIKRLQDLGEENLDKEIYIFDCATYYTPYQVTAITEDMGFHNKQLLKGILID